MKDFIEHERKMAKLVEQIQLPTLKLQEYFEKTNIYRFINYPIGIVNAVEKISIMNNFSAFASIKPYCLPNSLTKVSASLNALSSNLAMLTAGANSLFAAQSAVSNFVKQQQRFVETVEKIHLISQIFDEYYPIFDEELINRIRLIRKKDSKSLEKCIINYYKKNKYENLVKGYKIISDKKFVQNRIHILDSCIKSATKLSRKERYNIIIPTLTAQITGLMEDCINLIPKEFQNSRSDLKGRKLLLCYANDNFKDMYCVALQNIIEKTFCRTDTYKKLPSKEQERYNKIRPGILHGDTCCLDYGTEKNLILSWLELFLLVKIGEYFYSC